MRFKTGCCFSITLVVFIFVIASSVIAKPSYGENCADCHVTIPTTTIATNTSTTTIATNTTKTDPTTTISSEEGLIEIWHTMLYIVPTITALILSILGFVIIKRN